MDRGYGKHLMSFRERDAYVTEICRESLLLGMMLGMGLPVDRRSDVNPEVCFNGTNTLAAAREVSQNSAKPEALRALMDTLFGKAADPEVRIQDRILSSMHRIGANRQLETAWKGYRRVSGKTNFQEQAAEKKRQLEQLMEMADGSTEATHA